MTVIFVDISFFLCSSIYADFIDFFICFVVIKQYFFLFSFTVARVQLFFFYFILYSFVWDIVDSLRERHPQPRVVSYHPLVNNLIS